MLVPSSLRAYPLYPCTVGTYKPLACLPLMDPDLLSLAIPRKCVDASDIQLPSKSSSKVTHDGSSKSPTKPSMVDQLVQSALHYAGAAPTKSGHDTETVVTTPASSSHPSKMSRMHFYLTAPTTPSHRFQPFGRNPQAEASTTSPRPGKCTTGVCKTKRDTLDSIPERINPEKNDVSVFTHIAQCDLTPFTTSRGMTTPLAHMTDVLAWDIETTGLNKGRDLVTVVGFYSMRKVSGKGSDALEEHSEVVRLVELDHNGKLRYVDDFQEKAAYIAMLMECAQFLVSFNGVAFDLPFLEEQLHIDRLTMNRWMLKTFDVAEFGKRMWNRSFPLSLLLTVNNMHEGKIGSGLEAIDQARNGLWKELEDYCAQDAKITFQISMRGDIVVPEGYAFRKVNGGKALDDERVLVLHTGQFPEIWHSYRRPSICPCEGLV